MKKINFIHLVIVFIVLGFCPGLQSCKSGDKKPETKLVVIDTTKVLEGTIIEDGVAPVDDALAKGKPDKKKKEKIICSFNHKKFNTRKRPIEEAPGGTRGKPPKKPRPGEDTTTNPPDPPPPTGSNVIYINFFGKTISGTMWNTSGDFTVAHSGLSQSEMDYIVTQTKAGILDYNVIVTYDEAVFNSTPEGHKIEIIVTESWEWFGMAGGVAYLNSFFWTDATMGFVFSSLLNYNGHNIAEAIRHEACHTVGLRHQSDCDANGVVINQYRNGWTMGVSYYVPLGILGTGTSSLQCAIQDDRAMLLAAWGSKQFAYLRFRHQLGLKHQTSN